MAKQSDKYSLIRSMTHGNNGHETAAYLVQTARQPGDGTVYPCAGAVVSYFKGYSAGYAGLIPPYIVLTKPQGRFSEAGFLGSRFKPFATGGDPAASQFVVEGVIAQGITEQRQKDRRELLSDLNTLEHAMASDPELAALEQCDKQAYDLILGDAGKVFDLTQESADSANATAARLSGNPAYWLAVWSRRECPTPRSTTAAGILTKGISRPCSASCRDSTVDWPRCCRTSPIAACSKVRSSGVVESLAAPRVQWEPPWNGGRNHFGNVFSVLVAGGGFQGDRWSAHRLRKGKR